jgi:hypothetical protein
MRDSGKTAARIAGIHAIVRHSVADAADGPARCPVWLRQTVELVLFNAREFEFECRSA